jgi:zinc transport system substrate-binding protein
MFLLKHLNFRSAIVKNLNFTLTKSQKLLLILLVFIIFSIGLSGCVQTNPTPNDTDQPLIAVAIPPMETFVEQVCGDLAQTMTLIPAKASPANYEPTAVQIEQFANASLYFSLGVPTETVNILPYIAAQTKAVDLTIPVSTAYPDLEIKGERDPHIWLSPKRVIIMVEAIAEEMSTFDPDNSEIYHENAASYIDKLEKLDKEISAIFEQADQKTFIVFHPSFAYFADDYGLQMYAIEKEGKEATAKHLQEMLDLAIEKDLHIIFYQAEIDSSQTLAFAEAINGEAVILHPLALNYIENMKAMAQAITETNNEQTSIID